MTTPVTELHNRLAPAPLNALLAHAQKADYPGKYRLFRYLCKHYRSLLIRHQIAGRAFIVPVDEWCFWLEKGPENYYPQEILPFCETINACGQAVTLLDLGADIGVISSLVAANCPGLEQIVAVEPNPGAFDLLQENLRQLPVSTNAVPCAVSKFTGHDSFALSDTSTIDHEGHLYSSGATQVDVRQVDELVQHQVLGERCLVLKIDVEGEEERVIEGARRAIESAKHLIVLLEIHPDVLDRTSTTPEQLFNALERIRPMRWRVPALGNLQLDRRRQFFDQVPNSQYDVIGEATPAAL